MSPENSQHSPEQNSTVSIPHASAVAPYDAVLLVSFGGPEAPDQVRPFLEKVTRGRGVPPARLDEVEQHYLRFGGVSPINGQNRALLAKVRADLDEHGLAGLPVYWGNRHWHPLLTDVVATMRDDGIRHAAAFLTSAYASASSCRQYLDDIEAARQVVGDGAPRIDRLRQYYNHPRFVEPMVDAVRAALATLPPEARDGARLAFVAHSIPSAMDAASGPDGGAYTRQLTEAAGLVTRGVAAAERTAERDRSLSYCSRSGAPHVPWLEPSIEEAIDAMAADGASAVVVVPVGFVSDHMEVIFDLDTEALEHAAALGLPAARAATVGTDPRFVGLVRELVQERVGIVPARWLGDAGPAHDECPVWCCRPRTS